ncbi:MAG: DUF2314 domain-containing protein [Prosthecobacter sp.]
MKDFINRLTSMWSLSAALMVLMAWNAWNAVIRTQQPAFWVLVALHLVVVPGLLMRWRWAQKGAIALMLFVAAFNLYRMTREPFRWGLLMLPVSMVVSAYYLWRQPDNGIVDDFFTPEPKRGREEEADKPMVSLVHLRSRPRYLEAAVLANALSEAWGLKIGSGGSPADDDEQVDGFVAGENPIFMVMVHKPTFAMFTLHNHDRNYFDEAEEVADKVPNLRFAQIIRDHEAWLALDLVGGENTSLDQEEAYRMIGKGISALADDDVMAIFCPQQRFFNLWSPELEKILCGEAPLDALREEVKAPVIGVPDGETIEKAIAEARRRWPEFVAAFKQREPGDERFIVKAPFVGEDGKTEHMWLEVFGLEPEYVHGHLANHPIHTKKLKQGSQVEVPVAEVSDWVCPDAEGNAIGNFTHQAIEAASRPKPAPEAS